MRLDHILVSEGIEHIEDLAVDEFIRALRTFDEYEISEKIDGSNIQFGIDDNGFYTTREDFGGKRVYNETDYPVNFTTTFQRSAHAALEKVLPIMMRKGGLRNGDKVEVEVLYGELPNAIRYTGESNRLVLLRTVEGDVDIGQLSDAVQGTKVSVTLDVPFTVDGKEIKIAPEKNTWTFDKTPTVSGDIISKTDAMKQINTELDKMEAYLKKPSGVGKFSNAEILSLPLNKIPPGIEQADWKDVKSKVKDKREEVQQMVYHEDKESGERTGFKTKIKDILLNQLVRKVKSGFGPEIEDGGWIEGVVLRHKKSGELIKVVDKDIFSSIKDFMWQARKDIGDNPKSVNKIESFLGDLTVGLASAIGIPELGTTQAKRALKKHGDGKEEILASIASGFSFAPVKDYWEGFLKQKKSVLSDRLQAYKKNKGELSTEVDFGDAGKRTYTYDDEIDVRTLQVYAGLYERIENMQKGVANATTAEDLIMLLVGKQLSEL